MLKIILDIIKSYLYRRIMKLIYLTIDLYNDVLLFFFSLKYIVVLETKYKNNNKIQVMEYG